MSHPRLWLSSLFALALAAGACSDLGDVRQGGGGGGGGGGGVDAGDGGGGDGDGGGELGESLTVTMTTTPVGGSVYQPNNIVAVWLEDAAGNYVDTIAYYAAVRAQHLVGWRQASNLQQPDVVTGATRPSHNTPITAVWDISGAATPPADGTYTLRVEIADDNSSTPDQNHQASFTFDLNGTASSQDQSGQGLQAITLDYSGR